MTTKQNQRWRCKEAMTDATLPLQLCCKVTLCHRLGEALATTEGCSLAHIIDIQLSEWLRLVIAVRESFSLGLTCKLDVAHHLPRRDTFTLLARAEIGLNTLLVVVLEPTERTKDLIHRNKPHKRLYKPRRGNLCKRIEPRQSLSHLREILRYGNVRTEVEIPLQLIGIEVELTVEIVRCKPLHIEDFLWRRAVDST